jgi:hypothetical protein
MRRKVMGIAALHPSYGVRRRLLYRAATTRNAGCIAPPAPGAVRALLAT